MRTGSYKAFVSDLSTPLFRSAAVYMFVVIPLFFCLCWAGFAVRSYDKIRYYGLFLLDFGNLTDTVSLIKASPALPLNNVEGTGSLFYHLYCFTIPAWLSDAYGIGMANSNALAMCNFLVACLFFYTLCVAIWNCMPAFKSFNVAAAAAAIAIFAPSVMYFYQAAVALANKPWFSLGYRNNLLLTPVNSATVFGNNTLALVLVLIVVGLLREWNKQPKICVWIFIPIFMTAVIGYSVTLFFPLAFVIGIWLVTGRIKRPFVAAAISVCIGVIGLWILKQTNVLADSQRRLVVSFDRGQFFQNVVLSMLPMVVLALISLRHAHRFAIELALVIACILTPSFVYILGSASGLIDFSMKTGALLVGVLAVPAGTGLLVLASGGKERVFARALVGLFVSLGVVNTLVYAGQFAYYRLFDKDKRSTAMPVEYDHALKVIRESTPVNAIVIDPFSLDFKDFSSTVMLAERRSFLPTHYDLHYGTRDEYKELALKRLDNWQAWKNGMFASAELSSLFAKSADYILVSSDVLLPMDEWSKFQGVGGIMIYHSLKRR